MSARRTAQPTPSGGTDAEVRALLADLARQDKEIAEEFRRIEQEAQRATSELLRALQERRSAQLRSADLALRLRLATATVRRLRAVAVAARDGRAKDLKEAMAALSPQDLVDTSAPEP